MKRNLVLVPLAVVVLIISLLVCYKAIFLSNAKKIEAATASASISSKTDWDAGYGVNLTSSEPGNIEIFNMGISDILSEIGQNHPDQISVSENDSMKARVVDGDILTGWGVSSFDPGTKATILESWWKVDLGEIRTDIQKFRCYSMYPGEHDLQISTDGVNFSTISSFLVYADWYEYVPVEPITARYIRIYEYYDPAGDTHDVQTISEFQILSNAVATHTTAPTQIDGQEGDENKTLIEWTSFEATDNTPENTSITYEFRVSNDAENWTEWTSNFASLENRRYLQIRATLTSNDGVSTPRIDDYTINFHNNLPPNAPTAETVIIGK